MGNGLGRSGALLDLAVELGGERGEGLRRTFLDQPDPYLRLRAAESCRDAAARQRELAAVWSSIAAQGEWRRLLTRREPDAPLDGELPRLPPLPSPLEALTAPSSDLRRHALDELDASPRPDHVLALLLAAQLERWLARHRPDLATPQFRGIGWLTHLQALLREARAARLLGTCIEERVAYVDRIAPWPLESPLKFQQIEKRLPDDIRRELAHTIGLAESFVVDDILAAQLFLRTLPVPQQTTPELDELLAVGPEAFSARWPPSRLAPVERAALEALEAALAETVPA
jgi:hypothetical protein